NPPPGRAVKNMVSWSRSARQPAMTIRKGIAQVTDPGDAAMKRLSLLAMYVKDQDAAIEFYTKKLGFTLVEALPFGQERWDTLRLSDDNVVSIALNLAKSDEDRALVGKQGGSQPFFGIETDDCMREYRRMKEAGVKFHGEPKVEPYGTG